MKSAKAFKLENYIKAYIKRNSDVVNKTASGSKSLIKFSEAVSRAIAKSKKQDSGYGKNAENLASYGLSASGYSDYIKNRSSVALKNELDSIENSKITKEAEEAVRYENYLKELEENEAKELEKLKKQVSSHAMSNKITDYNELYRYAISSGLSEIEAKNIAEISTSQVKNEIRLQNIEKTRSVIISKRLTKAQAYEYAISLGLDDKDAAELAMFAYQMNQNADYIIGDSGSGGSIASESRPQNKSFNKIQLN